MKLGRAGEIIAGELDHVQHPSEIRSGNPHVPVVNKIRSSVIVLIERAVSHDPVRAKRPGVSMESVFAVDRAAGSNASFAGTDLRAVVAGSSDIMEPHDIFFSGVVINDFGPLESHRPAK